MVVDLTGVAVAAVSGIFSILAIVVPAWLASHIKDQRAAKVVSAAVENSLGAMQQAATSEIQIWHPVIPGVPAALAPGVQYVLGNDISFMGPNDISHRRHVTSFPFLL